jgi:hypothetical protein
MKVYLGNAWQAAHDDVFDTWLGCRSQCRRFAIAAEPGSDPQHIYFLVRPETIRLDLPVGGRGLHASHPRFGQKLLAQDRSALSRLQHGSLNLPVILESYPFFHVHAKPFSIL